MQRNAHLNVVHIFLSPIRNESRLLRECRALRSRCPSAQILVVGIRDPELPNDEVIEEKIHVCRIPAATRSWFRSPIFQLVKYLEWTTRAVSKMRRTTPSIVHAHSLPALLPAVIVRCFTGARLVYDAHELEARKSSRNALRNRYAESFERFLLRWVDEWIVVSEAIADWYADRYQTRRPTVVRNIPERRKVSAESSPASSLREKLGIESAAAVFIYQGVLSAARAVPRFLDVFKRMDQSRHLVLLGYGPLEDAICDAAQQHSNIHFIPAVPPDEVLSITAAADVGICGMGVGNESYRLSLPNKFFEYLYAGLPVLVGERPEQISIVEKYGCGWRVGDDDPQFVELVRGLTSSDIEAKRKAAKEAALGFSWESEAKKLLEVYGLASTVTAGGLDEVAGGLAGRGPS